MSTRYRRLIVTGLVCLLFSGCVRREGRNSDCRWPEEPGAKTLRTDEIGDARHLAADMEFGEELAIEYMDAHHGPRSGGFQSQSAASQALNGCLQSISGEIGKSHGVPGRQVAAFFGRRSLEADALIIGTFLALYFVVAGIAARWVFRRYPPRDGYGTVLVMTVLYSLALGVGGMLLGEQWSILAENLRVGTWHLSYRLQRLPWEQHKAVFCAVCVALFWCAAAVCWMRRRRGGCVAAC